MTAPLGLKTILGRDCFEEIFRRATSNLDILCLAIATQLWSDFFEPVIIRRGLKTYLRRMIVRLTNDPGDEEEWGTVAVRHAGWVIVYSICLQVDCISRKRHFYWEVQLWPPGEGDLLPGVSARRSRHIRSVTNGEDYPDFLLKSFQGNYFWKTHELPVYTPMPPFGSYPRL
jgi:hypothetical protein